MRPHNLQTDQRLNWCKGCGWSLCTKIFFIVVDSTVLFISFIAPPLTLENVLPVVKEMRSWWTLAKQLFSTTDELLDDFQRQHGSDEDCLKAVLESFFLGEGQ